MRRHVTRAARRGIRQRRAAAGTARGKHNPAGSQGIWMWFGVVVLAILAAAVISWIQQREPAVPDGFSEDAQAAVLERVVDGDTIVVRIGGTEERVRLLNIDTPETVHPNRPVECGGPEASEHLKDLLSPGDTVILEFDEDLRDRYDRLLAGVYAEGVLVNAEMAEAGWGEPVYFAPNARFLPEVEEAWAQAEAAGVGLFSDGLDCEPAL
ncbi:hypothetical protein GCM10025790_18930 [Nesterenkonia rhizosphaerae]|uniref:TNase-like domain-containing protein n=2 Tax=Nesterenkonia rhizosphaerae TaxID=1348272 RepID=A0ABP9FYX9_9MICC